MRSPKATVFYSKTKNQHLCCFLYLQNVSSLGVEPKFPASQASVLSIERRGLVFTCGVYPVE